jgi:hypothetical protein
MLGFARSLVSRGVYHTGPHVHEAGHSHVRKETVWEEVRPGLTQGLGGMGKRSEE